MPPLVIALLAFHVGALGHRPSSFVMPRRLPQPTRPALGAVTHPRRITLCRQLEERQMFFVDDFCCHGETFGVEASRSHDGAAAPRTSAAGTTNRDGVTFSKFVYADLMLRSVFANSTAISR